jgi:hypothetical protein
MTAKAKATRTASSKPAEPAAEPRSMYAESTTTWRAPDPAAEGDQPQPVRMGDDEEGQPSAYPDHAVGGVPGLSGGTASN